MPEPTEEQKQAAEKLLRVMTRAIAAVLQQWENDIAKALADEHAKAFLEGQRVGIVRAALAAKSLMNAEACSVRDVVTLISSLSPDPDAEVKQADSERACE